MNILDTIKAAVQKAEAAIGTEWHDHLEPDVKAFLANLLGLEWKAIVPIATQFVEAAIPAAVAAIESGNTDSYLDATWDAAQATAAQIAKTSEVVAIGAVNTAVSALIASSAAVQAAVPAPKAP